jgi:hypothetical protein
VDGIAEADEGRADDDKKQRDEPSTAMAETPPRPTTGFACRGRGWGRVTEHEGMQASAARPAHDGVVLGIGLHAGVSGLGGGPVTASIGAGNRSSP